MSQAFLSKATGAGSPAAETPFAAALEEEGATLEVRDGWRVATELRSPGDTSSPVRWADATPISVLEVLVSDGDEAKLAAAGPGGLAISQAVRSDGAWWCLSSPVRALVFSDSSDISGPRALCEQAGINTIDITTQLCAMRIEGKLSRELFARFCALDLRPDQTPVETFLAGSVARTPGYIIRETEDRYLTLVGSAYAQYFWELVSDAGRRLGGGPVTADTLSQGGTN